MRVLVVITDPQQVRRILRHLIKTGAARIPCCDARPVLRPDSPMSPRRLDRDPYRGFYQSACTRTTTWWSKRMGLGHFMKSNAPAAISPARRLWR
jgi:hypothetical protein